MINYLSAPLSASNTTVTFTTLMFPTSRLSYN